MVTTPALRLCRFVGIFLAAAAVGLVPMSAAADADDPVDEQLPAGPIVTPELPSASPAVAPGTRYVISGDWDGTGGDGIGVVVDPGKAGAPLRWYLRNGVDPGPATYVFYFGVSGDIPVAGDWTGDGRDNPGAVRATGTGDLRWYLRNAKGGDPNRVDYSFLYGIVGDRVVAGNWDGIGGDGPGAVRAEGKDLHWFLRNGVVGDGNPAYSYIYGLASDRITAGNWDGVGGDGPGAIRATTGGDWRWLLREANSGDPSHVDHSFLYGITSDQVVLHGGNWDGLGGDGPGVTRASGANVRWLLRNGVTEDHNPRYDFLFSDDSIRRLYDVSTFGLTWHPTDVADVNSLVSDPTFPGMGPFQPSNLLDGGGYAMTRDCATSGDTGLPESPAAVDWLCWTPADQATKGWNPQGITSSFDATGGGWGGKAALLSGWQVRSDTPDQSRFNDAKVALIDYSIPSSPHYRWVYLVVPTGAGNFVAAKTHVGGMAWYGDYLIVTGEKGKTAALMIFDLRKIVRMNTDRSDIIGKTGAKRYAFGYEYAVPMIATYNWTNVGGCGSGWPADKDPLCFDSISVDRSTTPVSLVTTEYVPSMPGGRAMRYDLGTAPTSGSSPDSPLLADSGGSYRPVEAYSIPRSNMQGVLSYNGDWWTASGAYTNRGWLFGTSTSGTRARSSCPAGAGRTNCWVVTPEAMTRYGSNVWSQTEIENGRRVFAVPLSRLP